MEENERRRVKSMVNEEDKRKHGSSEAVEKRGAQVE